jgi:GAF domain-containing protein
MRDAALTPGTRDRLPWYALSMPERENGKVATLRNVLARDGLVGGLGYLNSLTPHRFTGVFLADGEKLRNVALFDRTDAAARPWEAFPMLHSYCSIILATGESFSTSNSMDDERVREHAARESVRAYCGVPLLDREGRVLGTLCHFDFVAQSADLVDIELMLEIPAALAPYLPEGVRETER